MTPTKKPSPVRSGAAGKTSTLVKKVPLAKESKTTPTKKPPRIKKTIPASTAQKQKATSHPKKATVAKKAPPVKKLEAQKKPALVKKIIPAGTAQKQKATSHPKKVPVAKKALPAKKPLPAKKAAPAKKALPAKKPGAQKKPAVEKKQALKQVAKSPAKGGKKTAVKARAEKAAVPEAKPGHEKPVAVPSKTAAARSAAELLREEADAVLAHRPMVLKELPEDHVVKHKKPPVPKRTAAVYAADKKFIDEQKVALLEEKAIYEGQALALQAEAEALALEREPGDVQFDEESGEGGTIAVDRERDLAISAQARAAVGEIEDALDRIKRKSYGACEKCGQPILKARLKALPYARLCVACKSGGLSNR